MLVCFLNVSTASAAVSFTRFSSAFASHMSSTVGVALLLCNLEHLFNRGVAYLTLAHFYPNHVAYPVFPYPEYSSKMLDWRKATGRWYMNKGLTSLGEAVVEKMLDLGKYLL